jgi:hypothetical protein
LNSPEFWPRKNFSEMNDSKESLLQKSVADLLSLYPHLKLQPNNRIQCQLTKHEMTPKVSAVVQYVLGEKYRKACTWYSLDYSQYQPYIVPHKSNPYKLYCTITKQELNKIPKEVENHFTGKRFQRLVFSILVYDP